MKQGPRPPQPPDESPTPAVPSVLRMQLGRALQKHRLEAGLTQGELAQFASLSLKYVGEVERGAANPTLDVLERLAAGAKWDLVKTIEGIHEPITEGVRLLLIELVKDVIATLQHAVKWLEALDPRFLRLRSQDAPQDTVHPAGEEQKRSRLGSALQRLRRR